MIDFNDIDNNGKSTGEYNYEASSLIPDGEIVKAVIKLRETDGNIIYVSKNDESTRYLNVSYIVQGGEYSGNHVFDLIGISGNEKFVKFGNTKIRYILASSRGYALTDVSLIASKTRQINDYRDLNGLVVQFIVGIQRASNPKYSDKNTVARILTPCDAKYINLTTNETKTIKPKRVSIEDIVDDDIPF